MKNPHKKKNCKKYTENAKKDQKYWKKIRPQNFN